MDMKWCVICWPLNIRHIQEKQAITEFWNAWNTKTYRDGKTQESGPMFCSPHLHPARDSMKSSSSSSSPLVTLPLCKARKSLRAGSHLQRCWGTNMFYYVVPHVTHIITEATRDCLTTKSQKDPLQQQPKPVKCTLHSLHRESIIIIISPFNSLNHFQLSSIHL